MALVPVPERSEPTVGIDAAALGGELLIRPDGEHLIIGIDPHGPDQGIAVALDKDGFLALTMVLAKYIREGAFEGVALV